MSQETVSEGGSLGELEGENAPSNKMKIYRQQTGIYLNLTEGKTANTPQDDLATEHEM